MDTLVWIVNSYNGNTLALEKSFVERFFILEKDARLTCLKLNQHDGEGIWKVMPVLVRKQEEPAIDLTKPLANAIIDMEDIAFSEGQGPCDGPSTDAWEALVAEAEKAAGREADATRHRKLQT